MPGNNGRGREKNSIRFLQNVYKFFMLHSRASNFQEVLFVSVIALLWSETIGTKVWGMLIKKLHELLAKRRPERCMKRTVEKWGKWLVNCRRTHHHLILHRNDLLTFSHLAIIKRKMPFLHLIPREHSSCTRFQIECQISRETRWFIALYGFLPSRSIFPSFAARYNFECTSIEFASLRKKGFVRYFTAIAEI